MTISDNDEVSDRYPSPPPDFETYVREHRPRLRSFLRNMDDGYHVYDDALQDAFKIVYLKWEFLWRKGDPRAYLYTVAKHRLRELQRAADREKLQPLGDDPDQLVPAGDVETSLYEEPDTVKELYAALRRLPQRQREAVCLRYLPDGAKIFTEAETAAIMGISVGSVKTHTHRGLTRLREMLADSLGGSDLEGGAR